MKLLFAPLARRDMMETWEFIADDSVDHADRWRAQVEEKCRLIADSPGIGRKREDVGPGVLSLPFGNYVIFYRVAEGAVHVLRVMHGARDLPDAFAN